jgi:hypothetical protein
MMTGWKTWTATLIYVICAGAKQLWPQYAPVCDFIITTVVTPLGLVGIGHKLDKAREVNLNA